MKRLLPVVLLLAGCTPSIDTPAPIATADAPSPAAVPPPPMPPQDPATEWNRRLAALPPDAAVVVARVEACGHFAGEFNGDGSGRDREVAAKIEALHCATITDDLAAARERFRDDPHVLDMLRLAEEGLR